MLPFNTILQFFLLFLNPFFIEGSHIHTRYIYHACILFKRQHPSLCSYTNYVHKEYPYFHFLSIAVRYRKNDRQKSSNGIKKVLNKKKNINKT